MIPPPLFQRELQKKKRGQIGERKAQNYTKRNRIGERSEKKERILKFQGY